MSIDQKEWKEAIDTKNIKAILFDSGRVLNISRTGHWFVSPNFFKFVDEKKFNSTLDSNKETAFRKAMEYIGGQPLISTEEEEFEHFCKFYEIFSEKLSELELSETHVQELAKDLVYNPEKYVFYDDVFEVIPKLSENYKLGIVSDAWPSLDRVYRHANLRDYFSTFVVSSIKGVLKPHELMYKTALEELNIKPEEAIFVDDNPRNCHGASRLGIKSIVLVRDKDDKDYTDYLRISSLTELLDIFK